MWIFFPARLTFLKFTFGSVEVKAIATMQVSCVLHKLFFLACAGYFKDCRNLVIKFHEGSLRTIRTDICILILSLTFSNRPNCCSEVTPE